VKWIVDREKQDVSAAEGPLGWMPRYEDLDVRVLKFSEEPFDEMMELDCEESLAEISSQDDLSHKLFSALPRAVPATRDLLVASLWRTPSDPASQ